ncbi:f-box domain-containing protein [Stemphylium lycopersici]|uniref:F-box domain-containing protein n=1 Tax=Stemphylium lycopersici TaxID=183478 RepID=A0A364NAA0_STELY|nr:f-box domain-containing protein [Stemphylium lycopersici]RAR09541.1 f-box domain-containing protein [Stemphylium lycopersici]RAR14249.1 f-box domain-containing protein [Stemphylium lycopersici]
MEKFQRGHALPEARARTRSATATSDKAIAKKRRSFGRAAGGFQSRFLASLRSKRKSGASDEELAPSPSSPFLDALFRLPEELHVYMLRELCVADLLALRRTSRVLNMMVTENAPALVRYWVKHRMGNLHLQLYPAPRPNAIDFPFLLTMRRRHIASIRLTRQLADHLVGEAVEQVCPRQKQLWTSVYERMLRLVFGVGYFLDEHRRLLLERDLGHIRPRSRIGYHVRTTPGIPEQERAILKKLDAPLRLQYFYMYCFVVQVLLQKMRPSNSAGAVEKFLRGWSNQPACSEDMAFFLILGGIGRVAKLLACPTYSERRRYLLTYRTHMSPHTSKCWRRHWKDAGVVSPALLDDIPCTQIGITQLDQIWAPLMGQMMEPGTRDFTEQEKRRYEELKISKKFINEVMGYDILQGRAADGGETDDEHEG